MAYDTVLAFDYTSLSDFNFKLYNTMGGHIFRAILTMVCLDLHWNPDTISSAIKLLASKNWLDKRFKGRQFSRLPTTAKSAAPSSKIFVACAGKCEQDTFEDVVHWFRGELLDDLKGLAPAGTPREGEYSAVADLKVQSMAGVYLLEAIASSVCRKELRLAPDTIAKATKQLVSADFLDKRFEGKTLSPLTPTSSGTSPSTQVFVSLVLRCKQDAFADGVRWFKTELLEDAMAASKTQMPVHQSPVLRGSNTSARRAAANVPSAIGTSPSMEITAKVSESTSELAAETTLSQESDNGGREERMCYGAEVMARVDRGMAVVWGAIGRMEELNRRWALVKAKYEMERASRGNVAISKQMTSPSSTGGDKLASGATSGERSTASRAPSRKQSHTQPEDDEDEIQFIMSPVLENYCAPQKRFKSLEDYPPGKRYPLLIAQARPPHVGASAARRQRCVRAQVKLHQILVEAGDWRSNEQNGEPARKRVRKSK